MNVIKNEVIVCFDVDDTLVLWNTDKTEGQLFHNPYDNSYTHLKPHKRHIELLKQYKGRGFHVRVWSAGGWQWAEAVVKTLGLESFVDSIETKPAKYIDDLEAKDVLGVRIYIKDEE
jgi:phosphoglycolate phosphatase-like HAD superfamily hydrolase